MAKAYWEIDNTEKKEEHIIKGVEDMEMFQFSVRRLKQEHSGREVLKITAYCDGEKYGVIITSLPKIDTANKELENIGVCLTRPQFTEWYHLIKANYYNIKPERREYLENTVPNDVIKIVLDYFREYVIEKKIEKENEKYYNIRSTDFTNELQGFDLDYSNKAIREALKLRKMIRCNSGRTDYAIKVEDHTVKFISFYAEKLEKEYVWESTECV